MLLERVPLGLKIHVPMEDPLGCRPSRSWWNVLIFQEKQKELTDDVGTTGTPAVAVRAANIASGGPGSEVDFSSKISSSIRTDRCFIESNMHQGLPSGNLT